MITSIKNFIKNNSIFLFILSVGAILRLWQINWGLPELYEEATPFRIAWQFWNWGNAGLDFNPRFFNYPALTFYIQFIAQVINYIAGYLFGSYPNLDAFGLTLTPLVVTARIVNVLFDCGTIIVIYFIAKEIADKRVALFAALLVAINPSHILHSHLIEVDPALTFFSTLSLLFIFRIYRQPRMKWYLLAGLFIGMATASKYTGAFLILVLVGTHLMRSASVQEGLRSLKERYLIFAIGLSAIVFFALNPYIILTPEKFMHDFSFEQYHVSYGHLGVVSSQSTIGYYLGDVLPWSFGWVFSLIIFASTIYFIVRREKKDLLLLLYPLIYLAIVSTWAMRAERYVLPVFPLLVLIGTIGIWRFGERLTEYLHQHQKENFLKSRLLQTVALSCLGLLIIFQPVLKDVNYLRSIGLPDTRSITKKWIQKNIPAGAAIATGPYGIEFEDSSYSVLSIPFLAVESERVAPFYDTRWYEDFDLLITSSVDYDRYVQEPEKYGEFLPYYDSLKTRWKLAFEIKPSDFQEGPAFRLYTCPDTLRQSVLDISVFKRLYANPESTRISNFLKELYAITVRKGKLEKSEQLIREILSVEVDNVPLRNQLAQILFHLGKYEATLRHLELSLRRDQNQPRVYALAGSSLIKLNKLKEAVGVLNKAISIDPKFEQPYLELAELYRSTRDKMGLLDILKRYLAILPGESEQANKIRAQIEQLKKLR